VPFTTLVPGAGREIITQVDATNPAPGTFAVWFIGQAGFILKFGDGPVVYLDPWLSDLNGATRAYPIPLDPNLITHCDVLITSHDHGDHIDVDADQIIMQQSPGAIWVAPRAAETLVRGLGGTEERTVLVNGDDVVEVAGLRITALPSTHYGFFDERRYTDAEEGYYRTIPANLPEERRGTERFLGFVIEHGGFVIYFAGDNCGYRGFLERLAQWPTFDLMLLPINGRDWFREQRGAIGNFTYREAAQVASAANANLLVPYHYDGFVANNEYPDALVRYTQTDGPHIAVRVMQLGERLLVVRE